MKSVRVQFLESFYLSEEELDGATVDKKIDADLVKLTAGLNTYITSLKALDPSKMPMGSKWAQALGSEDGLKKLQDLTTMIQASLKDTIELQNMMKQAKVPEKPTVPV